MERLRIFVISAIAINFSIFGIYTFRNLYNLSDNQIELTKTIRQPGEFIWRYSEITRYITLLQLYISKQGADNDDITALPSQPAAVFLRSNVNAALGPQYIRHYFSDEQIASLINMRNDLDALRDYARLNDLHNAKSTLDKLYTSARPLAVSISNYDYPRAEKLMLEQRQEQRSFTYNLWVMVGFAIILFFSLSILNRKIAQSVIDKEQQLLGQIGALTAGHLHDLTHKLREVDGNIETAAMNPEKGFSALVDARSTIDSIFTLSGRIMDAVCDPNQIKTYSPQEDIIKELKSNLELQHRYVELKIRGNSEYLYPLAIIELIIEELVRNAREAIEKLNGAVQGKIRIHLAFKDSNLTIHVIDNGRGMSIEARKKAMMPFNEASVARGKMGLGLFAVSSLANRLGGNTKIISKPGKGTEIRVTLPSRRANNDD